MNKEAYLAGAYRPGTTRYRMGVRRYGPLPVPAPVVEKKAEKKAEKKPKVIKKTVKNKTEE